ncbi:hypothetical protein R3W88_011517 [Solanum pinnatisectum]|uniref:Phosphatidic acid phosphatase type 2/haloperoxidase domain-containing protein n=1 Tax=Solanum pinnatisectum TaxID=50273 RepID=A0AAV9L6R4_9SOLN|nr:hypothetical protein R3W88_011517 [Solanum pinnatisectum]
MIQLKRSVIQSISGYYVIEVCARRKNSTFTVYGNGIPFPIHVEAFQPNGDVNCHGDPKVVKEGYKSFPSGHTSWSFAGLAFLSWYLCGKVKAFDRRGHAAKLCIVLLPLLFAALVGISRIDDYWHHWTDVFTGSIIGSVVASLCYLLFFPFPHDINENIELHSTSIGIDTV